MVTHGTNPASRHRSALPALFILVFAFSSNVAAQGPTVLTAGPSKVAIDRPITFSVAIKSGDDDPRQHTYEFNWYKDSEGAPYSTDHTTSPTVTHQFQRPGLYHVQARILYSEGSGPFTNIVTVEVYDPAQTSQPARVKPAVPNLIGLPPAEAGAALRERGFKPNPIVPGVERSLVVHQEPAAGESIEAGSTVSFTSAVLLINGLDKSGEAHVNQEVNIAAVLDPPPPSGSTVRYCFMWTADQQPGVCKESDSGKPVQGSTTYHEAKSILLSVSAEFVGRLDSIGRSQTILVLDQPKLVPVPDVIGMTLTRAAETVNQARLMPLAVNAARQDTLVVGQAPDPKTMVAAGSKVSFTTADLSLKGLTGDVQVNQKFSVVASLQPPPPPGTKVRYCFTWQSQIKPLCQTSATTAIAKNSYSYGQPGKNLLSVSAAVDAGDIIKRSLPITVAPQHFDISLTPESSNPKAGASDVFKAELSPAAPAGKSVEYCFTWDKGPKFGCQALPEASHTFDSAGQYPVSVVATIDGQEVAKKSVEITVQADKNDAGVQPKPPNPSGDQNPGKPNTTPGKHHPSPWWLLTLPPAAYGLYTLYKLRILVRIKVFAKPEFSPHMTLRTQPAKNAFVRVHWVRSEPVLQLKPATGIVLKKKEAHVA